MKHKYLNYISDNHLLKCIENLHNSYISAKANINKSKFYKNKIDIIKLTFDTHFNNLNEKDIVESELIRQIDKSINNSIGTFHEEILGGINGYEMGHLSGFDIKAKNNNLFADIKNKHNTMNSSAAESLFQKLARYADNYKKSKCYWVQIWAKKSFLEKWSGDINGKEYSHSRVYKVSGDKFYELLTNQPDALYQLYKILPIAISDYLNQISNTSNSGDESALNEIISESLNFDRTIINQISYDNYNYYKGFEDL